MRHMDALFSLGDKYGVVQCIILCWSTGPHHCMDQYGTTIRIIGCSDVWEVMLLGYKTG